jgi:hypothetical protein
MSHHNHARRKHRHSGWGLSDHLYNPECLLLYNFDIDSPELKLEHKEDLRQRIVPALKFHHGVAVVGLASRTGSSAHNLDLSLRRAKATLAFLRSQAGNEFDARPAIGFGDMKATQEGYRPHTEDPRFRSVVVLLGEQRVAPFPPNVFDVTPKLPGDLPEGGFHFELGKSIDIASGIAQFLELMPWEKLAEFGEKADIYTAVLGNLLGMGLLWHDVDEQNLFNGRVEGFWEAMQFMADQYASPALSKTALKKWPALRQPTPRAMSEGTYDTAHRKWMQGRQEGCDEAWEAIGIMERLPEVKNNWEITGRRYLFVLSQKFRSGVAAAIHAQVDDQIKKAGKGNWPLRRND